MKTWSAPGRPFNVGPLRRSTMRGVFSKLPADTLASALAPIANTCQVLDWSVDLYSGPLEFPYYDENDPRNLLAWYSEGDEFTRGWFKRGFLPRYADCLILDEGSSYLGFDSNKLSPAELTRLLGGVDWGHQPRAELFEIVAAYDLLLILRMDTGWWEGYSTDPGLLDAMRNGWSGHWVDSARWHGGWISFPGDSEVT